MRISPFGRNEHGGVEEGIGPTRVDLEKGSALDPYLVFLCHFGEAIGVGIGDFHRQFLYQLFDRFVDGTGVGKLREDDEADIVKGLVTDHRVFQLFDQPGGHSFHLVAVTGMGMIGLTAGGVVKQRSSFRSPRWTC